MNVRRIRANGFFMAKAVIISSAVKSLYQSDLSENRQLVFGQAVTRINCGNLTWSAIRRRRDTIRIRELTPLDFRRTLALSRHG
jgi:hypothetical protein